MDNKICTRCNKPTIPVESARKTCVICGEKQKAFKLLNKRKIEKCSVEGCRYNVEKVGDNCDYHIKLLDPNSKKCSRCHNPFVSPENYNNESCPTCIEDQRNRAKEKRLNKITCIYDKKECKFTAIIEGYCRTHYKEKQKELNIKNGVYECASKWKCTNTVKSITDKCETCVTREKDYEKERYLKRQMNK